jgi:hypothetical protein
MYQTFAVRIALFMDAAIRDGSGPSVYSIFVLMSDINASCMVPIGPEIK